MDSNLHHEECSPKVWNLPCQEERLFPSDSEYSVFVQHIDEDGAVWVMLESEVQIMEVISEALNSTLTEETISKPVLKQAVSALNEDGVRYRAIIKRIEPDLCVKFIDFGDERVVGVKDLAPLPAPLSVIRALAMRVNLPVDSTAVPIVGGSLLVKHVKTDRGAVTVDARVPNPVVLPPSEYSQIQELPCLSVCAESDVSESTNARAMPDENVTLLDVELSAPPLHLHSQLGSIEDSLKLAQGENSKDAEEPETKEVSENLEASASCVVLERDGGDQVGGRMESPVDNVTIDFPIVLDAQIQSHSVSRSIPEATVDANSLSEKTICVAGTAVKTTSSEEGEFHISSKGSSIADSKDFPPTPSSQSEFISACKGDSKEKENLSHEGAQEPSHDSLISTLGRHPHIGAGSALETLHSNGYVDMGGAGDGRVNSNVYRNAPRKITKGRNSPNFRPFSPQPLNPPVPPQTNLPASNAKPAPQKLVVSTSHQDFKTILDFELAIIREQNRLQMLQLQKKMEKDLALNMKMVKDELAAFRNEVNGRLSMINDSVVHKMADIYSDIAMIKNDRELNRGPAVGSSQVRQFQSTDSRSKQPFGTGLRNLQESTNTYKSNQSHYNDNHHGNPNFGGEFQSNAQNLYPRQALETFCEKDTNNMDSSNVPPNRLMSQRKEKMMDRENPHRQQSNFSVGLYNPNEYPKVDYFDPSKTGAESDNELNNKKGSSGCIVCVNNLCPEKITPDLLFNLFGVYGNVQRVKISAQDKGRAYIEMADPAQAEEVVRHLNNVQLMGLRLHVTRCSFERLNLSRQEFQTNMCKDFTKPQLAKLHRYHFIKWDAQKLYPPSSKLMLSNVLSSVTDEKIKGEFSKNGFHIQNIFNQVCSNEEKKLVFVTLSSVEEAVNALTVMHLKELSDWMMMRISFAKV